MVSGDTVATATYLRDSSSIYLFSQQSPHQDQCHGNQVGNELEVCDLRELSFWPASVRCMESV